MIHKFIKITEIDRQTKHINSSKIYGAIVGCAECGETRIVWEDGVIQITNKSKTPCQKKSQ